jgi:hypothetical protein
MGLEKRGKGTGPMEDRDGCLEGLFKLLMLTAVTDYLQRRFGFGRGCSCTGIGCGMVLLVCFVVFACSILTGTDWTRLQIAWPF